MPRARPEMMEMPWELRFLASLKAVSFPYSDGERMPTMATAGWSSSREPLT